MADTESTTLQTAPESALLTEAQQAKLQKRLDRKLARKAAKHEQQDSAIGHKKHKKRQRSDSDADIQSLLVPTLADLPAPTKDDSKAGAIEMKQEASAPLAEVAVTDQHKKKKRKSKQAEPAPLDTVAEAAAAQGEETSKQRKKRQREERRQAAAAAEEKGDVNAETVVEPASEAERSHKKVKKSKKERAAVKTTDDSAAGPADEATADDKATRKALRAAKKERKRLAAELKEAEKSAAAPQVAAPQASTSKLARPAKPVQEDDVDAIFAAAVAKPCHIRKSKPSAPKEVKAKDTVVEKMKPMGKGKGKQVAEEDSYDEGASAEDESEAGPMPEPGEPVVGPVKKVRSKKISPGNQALESEWQKMGLSGPGLELASSWLSLAKVKALAAEHNFKYRQGKFTLSEEKRITAALESYRLQHGLTHSQLTAAILQDRRQRSVKDKEMPLGHDLWTTLAKAVGGRPVLAVYNHVKRAYDPNAKSGNWVASEDAALRAAVLELGSQWTQIGHKVGRNPTDCKDRYTKHLEPKVPGKRKVGAWEAGEEDKLRELIKKHGNNWVTIEKQMDGRTATQCRIKWRDSLNRQDALRAAAAAAADDASSSDDSDAPEQAKVPRFNELDRSRLIHAVKDLNVPDETEIDFNDIGDKLLQPHGGKNLRDRWRHIRRAAQKELGDDASFDEIMKHLLEQHPERGALPLKPMKMRPKKIKEKSTPIGKYKSAAIVDSSDDESSVAASASEVDDNESD